jgi:hypothetical protein
MLSDKQKGNLIESLIANTLLLESDGELCANIPLIDDFGVDMIVNKKGIYKVLFLQIKSRFVTNSMYPNRIDFIIKFDSFLPDKYYYILLVYYDQVKKAIDTMWLIPSNDVENIKSWKGPTKIGTVCRLVGSISGDSKDKLSPYKVNEKELVQKIQSILRVRAYYNHVLG